MKSELHKAIRAACGPGQMFQAGDRIGVAVSGGADSVALLFLLLDLRAELGITLAALHFNHRLRQTADADEQFVRELAESRGLAFISHREDVAAQAKLSGGNLEDVARGYRYEFFARTLALGQATRVATAHTADDQAETVLSRLVRGTGPLGLAGIYPVVGQVIRPLLAIRRRQLRDFLRSRGQPWREDETNLDTSRLRARIRHRLLPSLEQDFTLAIVGNLARLAELARADEAFWSELVEDRFQRLVSSNSGKFSISIADLLHPLHLGERKQASGQSTAGHALTLRLIRRIVELAKGDRLQVTAQHVEQVVRLARASSSGHKVELPGGLLVERSLDRLLFLSCAGAGAARRQFGETRRGPSAYSYAVELPVQGASVVEVAETGKRVRLKLIDWSHTRRDTVSVPGALDADRLRRPLVLRSWKLGDAYRAAGHRHSRKLTDLLLRNRVPASERAGWPVLTSAGKLAWVRGLPAAAEFAATAATRTGLVISEEMG